MARPKKRKVGRKKTNDPTSYSLKSPNSLRFYNLLAKRKSRDQVAQCQPSPPAISSPVATGPGTSCSPSQPGSDSTVSRRSPKKGPGRPPLDPEVGPMSPDTLGDRKRKLREEN